MWPGVYLGGMNVSNLQRFLQTIYARAVFYPTLGWNYFLARVLRIRHWSDRIDPHVIVGAYPFAGDVATMSEQGVAAVVNTCAEYGGPQTQYAMFGIEQLHIPTTDFTHPTADDVDRAVEFVQYYASRGQTVYIHCKAGRARSATVALAWLVKYCNMTPAVAQQHLLAARPHINPKIKDRPVIAQLLLRWNEPNVSAES